MTPPIPQRVLDRVWDRIEIQDSDVCWPWLLSIASHGYGQVGWSDSAKTYMTTAHRAAWTAVHGPIPEGMTVDHLCRNRLCCNPSHMRLLTNLENARGNHQSTRTICKWGHPYDEKNTRINSKGHRYCRACARERQRKDA